MNKKTLILVVIILVIILAYGYINSTSKVIAPNNNEANIDKTEVKSGNKTNNKVDNKLNNKEKNMKLGIKVTQEGRGDRKTKEGDTISVNYTGKLTDGTKFDSSLDRGVPFEFTIGQGMVIEGWEKGFLDMKVGEKRVLTIPSEMGYGSRGAGKIIPPNATLIFDVELMGIK